MFCLCGAGVGGDKDKVRAGSEEGYKGASLKEGIWGCGVARLTALRATANSAAVLNVYLRL